MTTWPGVGSSGGEIPLDKLIERRGALSPESSLLILRESLLSLAAAHEHGTVHPDYRPAIVFVDRDGSSGLADFGLSPQPGRLGSAREALYRAPELRNGAAASPASNLYAATAVFFECLTGSVPSRARIRQFRRRQLAAAMPLGQAFEPLCGLMVRGMAGSPADRPASARGFAAELDGLAAAMYGPDWRQRGRRDLAERVALPLTAAPGAAAGAGSGRLAGRFGGRKRALYAGAAAIVALVVLGGPEARSRFPVSSVRAPRTPRPAPARGRHRAPPPHRLRHRRPGRPPWPPRPRPAARRSSPPMRP